MCYSIPRRIWLSLAACVLFGIPTASPAQASPKAPIFLRQIRIHPSMFGAGIDTTRMRTDILEVVRSAGRLAGEGSQEALSLDVILTGPQPNEDGTMHMRGYVRLEVGANQAARGAG